MFSQLQVDNNEKWCKQLKENHFPVLVVKKSTLHSFLPFFHFQKFIKDFLFLQKNLGEIFTAYKHINQHESIKLWSTHKLTQFYCVNLLQL